jgi:hypothetical protein
LRIRARRTRKMVDSYGATGYDGFTVAKRAPEQHPTGEGPEQQENIMAEVKKDNSVTVALTDGRLVEFAGKQRMKKEWLKGADGSLAIRFDFVNGETRTYPLAPDMLADFALHGAGQKYGDESAGLKGEDGAPADIDDIIQVTDELHVRLYDKREWTVGRGEGGTAAGSSILAKALQEFSGQSQAEVREILSGITNKEKAALRQMDGIRQIVRRLEDEKVSKAKPSDALVGVLAKLKG